MSERDRERESERARAREGECERVRVRANEWEIGRERWRAGGGRGQHRPPALAHLQPAKTLDDNMDDIWMINF